MNNVITVTTYVTPITMKMLAIPKVLTRGPKKAGPITDEAPKIME
jgi:hypothetical protein